jgi:hypothetical protein
MSQIFLTKDSFTNTDPSVISSFPKKSNLETSWFKPSPLPKLSNLPGKKKETVSLSGRDIKRVFGQKINFLKNAYLDKNQIERSPLHFSPILPDSSASSFSPLLPEPLPKLKKVKKKKKKKAKASEISMAPIPEDIYNPPEPYIPDFLKENVPSEESIPSVALEPEKSKFPFLWVGIIVIVILLVRKA